MTFRTAVAVLLVVAFGVSPLRAQQPAGDPQPAKGQATTKRPTPAKGQAPDKPSPQAQSPVIPARPTRTLANVNIELTITDHFGTGTPVKKTVSMISADGSSGRIRTTSGAAGSTLNVDATPRLVEGDRVWLTLTVEYAPPPEKGAGTDQPTPRPAVVNEQLTIVLPNGKTMAISHAADPTSDRKISMEVKASILK